jgi:hypothetical protein
MRNITITNIGNTLIVQDKKDPLYNIQLALRDDIRLHGTASETDIGIAYNLSTKTYSVSLYEYDKHVTTFKVINDENGIHITKPFL